MPPPPHFGWPKMNFDRISRHFRSIRNFFFDFFHKMAAGGHFGWPKITFYHISRHFKSIRIFFFILFTKWLPAAILDDRKSLSIAFLAISDKYATLIFCSQNGCRRLFWMISDQYSTLICFLKFHKMAAGDHFRWPKITFDCISRHFRSIRNFNYFGSLICAKSNRVLPLCVINGYAEYEVDRWIHDTVRDATSFLKMFIQNGRQRPFCFSDWCQKS